MCTNALTTTKNTTHVISNKDTAEHGLLLCATQQPTVNSGNKTSAAHPYLRNCSNACLGVSTTRCPDAKNSGHHQAANTTAEQAMCINALITTKTQHMSSATKIQQSMNCCCVQIDNSPSTQATKHLRLIRTCVTAATPVRESQRQMS